MLAALASATWAGTAGCGESHLVKGGDVSFLEQVEDGGGVYTENGEPADLLEILGNHGFNFVRLRVWVDPPDGYCDLESTLRAAARAKEAGLGLLIDLHYSDTWADPGRQSKPAAWSGATGEALRDSVRGYTTAVIAALGAQGTLPDMVQIGNEVTCGMLWDDGRVCDSFDTDGQWDAFAGLVAAGIEGVENAVGPDDDVQTMIHIDRGGDNAACRWFYDNLLARGVDFDLVGLSFYPWWHGDLDDLGANLADLSQRYGKGIVIVETAYPWTLDWCDDTGNIVGPSADLLPGYPATVEGQRAFLSDLMAVVAGLPDGRGVGIFYWEPEWITAPSSGSAWENVTLFDFSGEVLTSIGAFDSTYAGVGAPTGSAPAVELNRAHPNPLRTSTCIGFDRPPQGGVMVDVYDLLGREIWATCTDGPSGGPTSIIWDGTDRRGVHVAPGLYVYRVRWDGGESSGKVVVLD